MKHSSLLVSPESLVERILQFSEARHRKAHHRFLCEMITGIIATGSTVISQIARFLNEQQSLASTENRLCKMLGNKALDWDDLRLRALKLGGRKVKMNVTS